ncbi:hypothetical protein [Actinomadura sp. DC4]|uniref:maleylpyruvate isomerase N-terminal domain-containing protein n=1 Tax=Actinomadura sp. DC4 TaxID=3055069 RepID=UPI0025B1524C|nr:hypothetical protein [Actinomadura sp. DC4]MDN3354099.1 hypothetical protein [Actinomadura sp. DC4]
MAATIEKDQWQGVRTSVRETGDRFAEMVATAKDPGAEVTPNWSVAVTAAHVTSLAWLNTTLLGPGAEPLPVPGLTERLPETTVDDVNAINDLTLAHFIERDPQVLAAMLRDHIGTMLDSSEGRDPSEPLTWLGGAQVPVAGLFAHLLNELLLHGHDIARTTGHPWAVPSKDAAYFFEMFMVGLARNGVGRLLDGGGPPRDRRIAVEFRSDYVEPVTLVLRNGRVTAEPPGEDTDVRVRFDPAVFTLMMFGRVSKPRAVLARKVSVGGRRPWLLPVFLRTLRVPS